MTRKSPVILIFHPGALGDGLLAVPALRVLKRKYPRHRVIWFGHKDLGEVLVEAQEIHESYNFERLNISILENSKPILNEFCSDLFESCDKAVAWLNDSDETWQNWFMALGIKNVIICSPHDPTLRSLHMADRYVETLSPWFSSQGVLANLGKTCDKKFFSLRIQPKSVNEQPDLTNEKVIILHPGSGSIHKLAPLNLLADIARGVMVEFQCKVCLVEGPADAESCGKVEDLLQNVELPHLKNLGLTRIANILQRATLFIGHDSGLSHLAARIGIPTVLLFGPTDSNKWAPRGPHVDVIKKPCHCVGKEAIDTCSDRQCFNMSPWEVMTKAKKVLRQLKVSAPQVPSDLFIRSASCLALSRLLC